MKSLLTVQEAAICLRVNRSTVWRWCKDGTLSTAFKIGRNWRIHQAEVEGIIEQRLIENEDERSITEDKVKNLDL